MAITLGACGRRSRNRVDSAVAAQVFPRAGPVGEESLIGQFSGFAQNRRCKLTGLPPARSEASFVTASRESDVDPRHNAATSGAPAATEESDLSKLAALFGLNPEQETPAPDVDDHARHDQLAALFENPGGRDAEGRATET